MMRSHDGITARAMGEVLAAAIDREVTPHRPVIIPLLTKVEAIASHELNERALGFLERLRREKEKFENAFGVEQRLSSSR